VPQLSGVLVVERGSPAYPQSLESISAPPARLYVRGTLPPAAAVAIVGTRTPTGFGLEFAAAAARSAVRAGLGVVSGLAPGCDTAAHRAALEAGGRTWAVIGSGVDRPTPATNARLAEAIVAGGGGVIAEVSPTTAATTRQLVARDRIQAGLSLAVVVCQSDLASGTMHTVRFAVLAGRLLAVARPAGADAEVPASAGNIALSDAAGCDPALLHARSQAARAIAARRPLADVVIDGEPDLDPLWELCRGRL
jgi:DNA processing protein